jgi:hypothetical protein
MAVGASVELILSMFIVGTMEVLRRQAAIRVPMS